MLGALQPGGYILSEGNELVKYDIPPFFQQTIRCILKRIPPCSSVTSLVLPLLLSVGFQTLGHETAALGALIKLLTHEITSRFAFVSGPISRLRSQH